MVTGSRVERKKYEKGNKSSSSETPKKNNKNKNTARKWIKRSVILLITLFFVALIAGGGLFAYYAMNAPDITESDLRGQISSKIYDRDGDLIKELGGQNRDLMTPEEMPEILKEAVLAIEDARFYSHKGVDPIRIVGSALANLRAGEITQGGSTITQQLVKLSVFSTDFQDQTLERKAQEAWLSLGLEQEYSKDEILTMYLNKMFYSNNTYGAKTAARNFFGKDIQEISLVEAALLAGIPQAPSDFDPYSFPEDARERRDLVLSVMLDRTIITQGEYDQAINTSIDSMLIPLNTNSLAEFDLIIDSYLDIVSQEVQEKMNLNIFTDGVEVYTNLDLDAQQKLYHTVNDNTEVVFPDDQMQTAVSIIDVETGQLVAVIGGRKQEVAFGLNRANTLNRSVGSTMKPLADYGPAFEHLNYSTATTIVDEAYTYSDGTPLYNFDLDYAGQMTLREALSGSRNVPALKLLQEVGLDNSYAFLQKLDINITNLNNRDLVEANAIGGEMTPIQLSAAYAAISNNGEFNAPYTVNRVVTAAGTVQEFTSTPRQAMKDSTAYMLVDILKGVPGPFAAAAQIEGLHHAGKTGTTDYNATQLAQIGLDTSTYAAPDGWYAGITPKYSIATWVGYDNYLVEGNYLTLDNTRIPQAIYAEMMSFMMQDLPNTDWLKPDSVVEVEIEKYSNPLQLPGPYTPAEMRSTELFVKGSEPTQQSLSYAPRYMNPPSWFDANYHEESKSIVAEWGALTDSGVFELSLNGVVIYTGTGTSFSLPVDGDGDYVLRLRIVEGNSASDTLVVTLTLTTTSEETDSSDTSESESEELPPDETSSIPADPNESLPPETSEPIETAPPA